MISITVVSDCNCCHYSKVPLPARPPGSCISPSPTSPIPSQLAPPVNPEHRVSLRKSSPIAPLIQSPSPGPLPPRPCCILLLTRLRLLWLGFTVDRISPQVRPARAAASAHFCSFYLSREILFRFCLWRSGSCTRRPLRCGKRGETGSRSLHLNVNVKKPLPNCAHTRLLPHRN